jgi:hypothetical protein
MESAVHRHGACYGWFLPVMLAAAVTAGFYYFKADLKRYINMSRM